MKKNYWILSGILVSTILVLFLMLFSAQLPNRKKNGFKRYWLEPKIKILNQTSLSIPLEKICGATNSNIYISIPNPQWLIMLNQDLQNVDTIFFPIKPNQRALQTNSFRVDSPHIVFFANNEPAFAYGNIKGKLVESLQIKSTKMLFTKAAYISPSTVVIRTFDSVSSRQIFQKINYNSGQIINQAVVVKNQEDAGFSTDGKLQYDSSTKRIIYLLNYQNRYFSIDTNLNVQYEGKTIDTTNVNDVKVKKIFLDGKDRLMPSNPRIMVNKESCVENGFLYVLSELKADNETFNNSRQNSVIDIYKIISGEYIGSFYVPHIINEKIKSISVKKNVLIVLHENKVSTFRLSLNNIKY